MRLPLELLAAIEREVEGRDPKVLARASRQLTERYQAGNRGAQSNPTQAQRIAYLTARFPATYAANWRVMAEIRRLAPEARISSILDLGAGPGTALFVAVEVFPDLVHATLVERDGAWVDVGQRLGGQSSHLAFQQAKWLQHDLCTGLEIDEGAHDLIVLSYVLGELDSSEAESVLSRAWLSARQFLAVVEPGTPAGFRVVHAARTAMIAKQAHILAPCPHRGGCPMLGTRDWCHFAQRLERTREHRLVKGAVLGHEDEKFSYVVASRQPFSSVEARIVRHPQKRSGHVLLTLCSRDSIKTCTVTRSDVTRYKLARQLDWGDSWPASV